MPRRMTAVCTVCKTPMQPSASVAAVPCCHQCRRTTSREEKLRLGIVKPVVHTDGRRVTCEQCGQDFTSHTKGTRFCSPQCVGDSQRVRPDDDRRVQRWKRDQRAPGISTHQRSRLLAKWKRQGRRCFYCPAPADTIDHLLPLVRGGGNYEGNLVPACRRCNSSKASRTVMEWRIGQSVPRAVSGALSLLPERDTRPALRLVQVRACRWCTRIIQGKRIAYCSDKCRDASTRARSGVPRRVKLTPEERRERKRAERKRWRQTPNGRECRRRAKAKARERRRVSTDQMTLAG